jgi:hypothetical protein
MTNDRNRFILLVSGVMMIALAIALMTHGCVRKSNPEDHEQATGEIAAASRLAAAFIDGTDWHGVNIRAERFDPVTQMLYGIRVDRRDAMIFADRAEIKIDETEDVANLTLFNVIVAHLPSEDDADGELSRHDQIALDPIPLNE